MARAKIQDVARLADVSLSTVSAVLNCKNIVKEDTKRRIIEAIDQLGYRPDLYASNLARHQTKTLGLIVSNLVNPFFSETAQAFEYEVRRRGYQITLAASGFSSEQLRMCVRHMLAMRVAGLAVVTSEYDDEAFRLLQSSGTPATFLDVAVPGKTISNIKVDSKRGMISAVRHLVELGHREILFIRNSRKLETSPTLLSHRSRSDGFTSAVRKYASRDAKAHVIDEPGPGAHAGLRAIESALKTTSFTAVVAITDMVALGVYRGLQAAGLRIPQDISVVGFDNTFLCEFLNPPLTTVNIPREELSRIAVDLLLAAVEDKAPGQERRLATQLIVRSSTAPPPGITRQKAAGGRRSRIGLAALPSTRS